MRNITIGFSLLRAGNLLPPAFNCNYTSSGFFEETLATGGTGLESRSGNLAYLQGPDFTLREEMPPRHSEADALSRLKNLSFLGILTKTNSSHRSKQGLGRFLSQNNQPCHNF